MMTRHMQIAMQLMECNEPLGRVSCRRSPQRIGCRACISSTRVAPTCRASRRFSQIASTLGACRPRTAPLKIERGSTSHLLSFPSTAERYCPSGRRTPRGRLWFACTAVAPPHRSTGRHPCGSVRARSVHTCYSTCEAGHLQMYIIRSHLQCV